MDYTWFKERYYLHFDPPISSKHIEHLAKFVSDPLQIEKHSFYPLIQFEVTKFKIRKEHESGSRKLDKSGKRELTYCSHLDAHRGLGKL